MEMLSAIRGGYTSLQYQQAIPGSVMTQSLQFIAARNAAQQPGFLCDRRDF